MNKYFGPALNATMALGNSVAGHTETLSSALYGAFSPAITNKAGAGKKKEMLQLAYRASKFGSVLCLLFALPLALELPYVLKLWLKNPPPRLAEACVWAMAFLLEGQFVRAIDLPVIAMGRVGKYSFVVGGFMILSLPVNWLLVHYDVCGFMSVFYVLVAFRVLVLPLSLPMAKKLVDFSPSYWMVHIVAPVVFVSIFTLAAGAVPRIFLPQSFIRLLLTGIACELFFLPMMWCVVFNATEREFVTKKLRSFVVKNKGRRFAK